MLQTNRFSLCFVNILKNTAKKLGFSTSNLNSKEKCLNSIKNKTLSVSKNRFSYSKSISNHI